MIPVLNISKLGDGWKGNTSEELGTFCAFAEPPGGNVGSLDGLRTQPEGNSSTPLRSCGAVKSTPRTARNASPIESVSRKYGDVMPSADLRRRAEDVVGVVGVNALQVEDVSFLKRKVIELGERLLRAEEWYNGQLRERSSYFEHRLAHLIPYSVGGGACGPATSDVERVWTSPSTIRSRPSPASTQPSRPTLNASSPTLAAVRVSTPTRENRGLTPERRHLRQSRHSSSLTGVATHLSLLDSNSSQSFANPSRFTLGKRRTKDLAATGTNGSFRSRVLTPDNGRQDYRKPRSSSLIAARAARGYWVGSNSPDVYKEEEYRRRRDLASLSFSLQQERMTSGGNAAARNTSASKRSFTPRRQRRSLGRIDCATGTGKRN